ATVTATPATISGLASCARRAARVAGTAGIDWGSIMRCDQVNACAAAGKFNTEPGKPIGRFLRKRKIAFEGNRIMAASIRSFTFIALICASTTASWAQQSGPSSQQPAPREDPAAVGAGPTSTAPGQTNY